MIVNALCQIFRHPHIQRPIALARQDINIIFLHLYIIAYPRSAAKILVAKRKSRNLLKLPSGFAGLNRRDTRCERPVPQVRVTSMPPTPEFTRRLFGGVGGSFIRNTKYHIRNTKTTPGFAGLNQRDTSDKRRVTKFPLAFSLYFSYSFPRNKAAPEGGKVLLKVLNGKCQ